jgi:sugar transferase (PEP-CTERM/EpsH1 system associated)
LKIYNLAKRLRQKHQLHLLTFAQSAEDLSYQAALQKIFHEVHIVSLPRWRSALQCLRALWDSKPLQVLYFQSAAMRQKLDELLRIHTYDAVHVQHLRMSPYLFQHKEVPRILDLPDAFSLYWERRKSIPRGMLARVVESMEQKRLLRYEPILESYDISLVCSPEDQTYLKQAHHISNIRLLPNGVDLDIFSPRRHDYSHNHTLLFTGNMDYAPNVDAVAYFVREILPAVHARYPQVRFVIAGQRPVKKVLALANDQVQVTGFMPSLAEAYNDASVVVAPLRFGAGTQNKVLEAMAMGVPVVCSSIGFNGLGIQSGEGAIMAADKQAFIDAVLGLLASEAQRRSVGTQGIEVVQAHFSWDTIALQLEQYFTEVCR